MIPSSTCPRQTSTSLATRTMLIASARPTPKSANGICLGNHSLDKGASITWMIDGDGNVTMKNNDLVESGVTAGELVSIHGIDHRVASVFWTFITTSQGVVYEVGQLVTENLFENPYSATGYPITEASGRT